MVRYPHIATIVFETEGSYNSEREYVKGQKVEINITCRIEPSGTGRFVKTEDGSKILIDSIVFSPLFEEDVPEGAKLRMYGKEYPIIRLFKWQKNVEIWL